MLPFKVHIVLSLMDQGFWRLWLSNTTHEKLASRRGCWDVFSRLSVQDGRKELPVDVTSGATGVVAVS